MDEVSAGQTAAAAPAPAPVKAGDLLRAAREAQGLSVADVGTRTRIPTRHLQAIENADYTALPSATYAVGFARAYARAVGADEVATAQAVRADVDRLGRRVPDYTPYDVADPTRVPSRGVAVAGLGVALAILALVALWYGTDWFRGGTAAQDVPAPVAETPAVRAPAAAAAAADAGGQVVLTARDEVWMRVYDAAGTTLFLGTMKPGDHFDVPPAARDPMINVGRPDKLAVTLNGSAMAPLGTGERAIKDVRVGAAALAARAAGRAAAATVAGTTVAATTVASPTPDRDAAPAERPAARARRTAPDRPRRPRAALSETQRANLDAASNPPPAVAGNSQP